MRRRTAVPTGGGGGGYDENLVYDDANIEASFPNSNNTSIDSTGNILVATADGGEAISILKAQDGGESDFIALTSDDIEFKGEFEFANISDESTADTLITHTPIADGDLLVIVLEDGSVHEIIASEVVEIPSIEFTSDTAMTMTPKYTNSGVTLEYSVDGRNTWTAIASGDTTSSSTSIEFRGQATGTKSLFTSETTDNAWVVNDATNVVAKGNLNYLLCDTMGDSVAPDYVDNYCYSYMFYGCPSLTVAPELPATTMADNCYSGMLRNCTSLTTAPELPATTLADWCYNSMFYGCSTLTTAPELPATTLADHCYYRMFRNCTSLTTAPELPATTLADYCYSYMFYSCSSLEISATNTGVYNKAWRIPASGTGVEATDWNIGTFTNTGGTFTSDPTIDTTYYVENTPA